MRKSVDGFLLGFNCTIFAYGQTGSGKTWSMFGDIHSETKAGVIPRACDHIFAYVEAHGISMGKDTKDSKMGTKDKVGHRSSVMSRLNVQKNVDFELNMTYVEIYRERVNDLLDPSKKDLKLKEVKGADGKASITIEDATEKKLLSKEDVMAALEIGGKNRATMSTGMNAESSRSHCLVIFNLVKITGVSRKKTTSRLNLIDLAGSERLKKTNVSGDMLEEAKAINGSLSALGQCIKALASSDNGKKKSGHVPFRDSKLTRLLQHSLIGNSRTLLLVGISPHEDNVEETRSTLGFAARAKLIKTSLSMSLAAADGDVKVVRSIDEIEAEVAKIKDVRDSNLKEFKETFKAIEVNKNAKVHRQAITKHESLLEKVAEALPFDPQNVLDEDKAAKEAKEKKSKAKAKAKSSMTGKPNAGKSSSMHMKKGRDPSSRNMKVATKGGGTPDKKGKVAKKPPAPPLKGSGRKGK
jgi:kinesin family protein 5